MSLVDYLLDRLINFIPILLSLTVHEWAHAWTAWKLGDDTAKLLGRVSLDPLEHIDPVGTLVLPLLGVPFGWAKPVPINPTRFRRGVSMSLGLLLATAAGPSSNLVLAGAAYAGLAAMMSLGHREIPGWLDAPSFASISQILQSLISINVALALFNLLPIPPLDGSRIVDALVPTNLRPAWIRFASIGPVLLVLVVLAPVIFGINLMAIPIEMIKDLVNDLLGAFAE